MPPTLILQPGPAEKLFGLEAQRSPERNGERQRKRPIKLYSACAQAEQRKR